MPEEDLWHVSLFGVPPHATIPADEVQDPVSPQTHPFPVGLDVDQLAKLLAPVMRAVATAVGPHCEVVLHDLRGEDFDHTVLAIENGGVSGRGAGGPSAHLGRMATRDESSERDQFGYRARTADGRDLTSSSVYFRDAGGDAVAALCVNVDLTPLQSVRATLAGMMPPAAGGEARSTAPDIESVLDDLIERAIAHVGMPVTLLGKPQRMEVLRFLNDRGAFSVKRAVPRTAKRLGISTVTAYGYLDEVRNPR
ncbi:helix-turn-helix transcriptional regulator [Xylanimonas allomyrinae]|uniref:helix-turn-helix transcriptional regulator n=1 Tax=Xylanimonas allomyrinae TaxID=2509459 RepID=UPI0013A6349E|nr:PAS domain-containing protein [Xylanimonas allomyrinae]